MSKAQYKYDPHEVYIRTIDGSRLTTTVESKELAEDICIRACGKDNAPFKLKDVAGKFVFISPKNVSYAVAQRIERDSQNEDGSRSIQHVYDYFKEVASGFPSVMDKELRFVDYENNEYVVAGYHPDTTNDGGMQITIVIAKDEKNTLKSDKPVR